MDAISCPSCGASLTPGNASGKAQMLICTNCGAGMSLPLTYPPNLPGSEQPSTASLGPLSLHANGSLGGISWEIVGTLTRACALSSAYERVHEYALYHPQHGFRYLLHSQGHWAWAQELTATEAGELSSADKDLSDAVILRHSAFKRSRSFRLYGECASQALRYAGELPYRQTPDETQQLALFLSPPWGLLRLSPMPDSDAPRWLLAKYLSTEEVRQAFGVDDLPAPPSRSLGLLQPSPYAALRNYTAWGFVAFAILLGLLYALLSLNTTVLVQNRYRLCTNKEPSVLTEPFTIQGSHTQPVEIWLNTDVDNRWFYADIALVNTLTDESKLLSTTISYYQGGKGKEAWKEGRRFERVIIPKVAPGTYVLRLDTQTGTTEQPDAILPANGKPQGPSKVLVNYELKVTASPVLIGMAPPMLILVVIFPVAFALLTYRDEYVRWADSPHRSQRAQTEK